MNTWKIILATLVIFIAGVVTGGLLVSYSDRAQQKHQRSWPREPTRYRIDNKQSAAGMRNQFPRPGFSGGMPKGLRMDFLERLGEEIHLTADQRTRIEKIIAEGQERNRQVWNRVLPEMRREIQATKERIRGVLTPEQVKRFEKLMRQPRPTGPRASEVPATQPNRRPRDLPRRPLPPREGPPPGTAPQ